MSHVYIVGAGLAGLAAAVKLTQAGRRVTLFDGAKQAGGRCRSFHDAQLDCRIDNGNHLMLSANWAVQEYAHTIGGCDGLHMSDKAQIPMMDLQTEERWTIDINEGRLPLWLFNPKRRVAGASLWQHLKLAPLLWCGRGQTVSHCTPSSGALYDRFVLPLTEAVLNVGPDRGSARLLKQVLVEAILPGGATAKPLIAKDGLTDALVDPALHYLQQHQVGIQFGQRLNGVERSANRITALSFAKDAQHLAADDQVIIALPPEKTGSLLDLAVPTEATPIVNVHYRLPDDVPPVAVPSLLGLVGGTAHWVFRRDQIASVTISNAAEVAQWDADRIAELCWTDVSTTLGMKGAPMPPVRVVKEKRATFLQTPDAVAKRPGTDVGLSNCFLAGDWTDTGLPATIEGAVRSGFKAAEKVLAA